MRTLLLSTLIIVGLGTLTAQNLVPNPSFEEYSICPDFTGQLERAIGWKSYRSSSDYHNACDLSTIVGVPYSQAGGFQQAKEGLAYAGYHQITSQGFTEAIGVQLEESLIVGQEYYISFFVNRSLYGGIQLAGNCWSNGQAVRFTNQEYNSWPIDETVPIDNYSHLFNSELVSDTAGWIQVQGYYTADDAYTYMSIGNFYEEENLEIECDQAYNDYLTYYFVDCVCVTSNPTDCESLVSVSEEQIINELPRVSPNPFLTHLDIYLPSPNSFNAFEVHDFSGRSIVHGTLEQSDRIYRSHKLSQIKPGLYFLVLHSDNHSTYLPIIKQ